MAREEVDVRVNGSPIHNGLFRLNKFYGSINGITGIAIEWLSEAVNPAGTLTFSFNGDTGVAPGVIDLGSGQRTLLVNTPLPFVDVAVTGLPANAQAVIYLR